MGFIFDIIKPTIVNYEIHRGYLTKKELVSHNLVHSSWSQVRTIKRMVTQVSILIAILVILWLFFKKIGLVIIVISLLAYLFVFINSLLRDIHQSRIIKPDIFYSFSYESQNLNPIEPISQLGAIISSFLIQEWGIVSLLPPKAISKIPKWRKNMGYYGSQWSFALYASDILKWEQTAKWLISQCRLAIFDLTESNSHSILKELTMATDVLGADNIVIIQKIDDCIIASVNGNNLPLPEKLLSKYQFDLPNDIASCATSIRLWLSEKYPVYDKNLKTRKRFLKFDYLMSKLTIALSLIFPLMLITGIIMLFF